MTEAPFVTSGSSKPALNLLLVTDAWHPQVNGVVRTVERTVERLASDHGVVTHVVHPGMFRAFSVPGEPGLKLAITAFNGFEKRLNDVDFDHIHIATEGPLGWAARRYALKHQRAYTTAFHTQFAEYLQERYRIPLDLTYGFLRKFHGPAARTLVTTPSMKARLKARGFERMTLWSRGVDTRQFTPDGPLPDEQSHDWRTWERPFMINVGRVAPEKNLPAFLDLKLPGTKIVVGDGPARAELMKRYPDAKFLGMRTGEALAAWYRLADVKVFPSRTDTFGLVNVEALACGTPVAAYPVEGPADIIEDAVSGALDEDLELAVHRALDIDPAASVARAAQFTWKHASDQFLEAMVTYHSRWREDE